MESSEPSAEFYYHDNDPSTPMTDPHHSGKSCPLEELTKIGVIYKHLKTMEEVNELSAKRNYKNRDEVKLDSLLTPNLDEKLENFYSEHFHEDEEIRYVLDGEGYFDVRDLNENWIRIKLFKNDLAILPAGIYHRFTLTSTRSIHALRLFKDEPKWIALNKGSAETVDNPYRNEYLKSVKC